MVAENNVSRVAKLGKHAPANIVSRNMFPPLTGAKGFNFSLESSVKPRQLQWAITANLSVTMSQ